MAHQGGRKAAWRQDEERAMSVQSYGNPAFQCSPPGALPSSAGVLFYSLNKLHVSYRKKIPRQRKEGGIHKENARRDE